MSTLEETVRANSGFVQEILVQLRQAREDNKLLRVRHAVWIYLLHNEVFYIF